MKIVSKQIDWLIALLLAALSLTWHAGFLTHAHGLWRDEVNTVTVATLPSLGQLWRTLPYESFPLLPFGVIRCWAAMVGAQNDFGLRIFGFVVGAGILGALWFNARVTHRTVPIWSLVLLGFNILVIRCGDSVRAYGLGMFFILLTVGLVWRAVESPSRRRLAVAALAGILSVQTLYSNAFLLAAICGAGALSCGLNRQWKKTGLMLGIGLPAALSLLPYLDIIHRSGLINRPLHQAFDWQQAWSVLSDALGPVTAVFWLLAGAVTAVGGVCVLLFHKNLSTVEKSRGLYALGVVVGSTVFFTIFSFVAGLRFSQWYYLSLMAVWAAGMELMISVMIEAGRASPRLEALPQWRPGLFFAAVRLTGQVVMPLALVIFLMISARPLPLLRQSNLDWFAGKLQASADKEDFIVVNPWYCGVGFNRYYHGPTPWQTVPPLPDHSIHRYDLIWENMTSRPEESLRRVTDQITRVLRSNHRVWLIGQFIRPKAGEKLAELPPATTDAGAWKNGQDISVYYQAAWTHNLSSFLDAHSRDALQMLPPQEAANVFFERPDVFKFEGWRE